MAAAYRDTQGFLERAPFPARLAHLRPSIEKLPLRSVAEITFGCAALGLGDDAVANALESAVDFQEQSAWRCPICFRWQNDQGLIVVAIVDGKVSFHSVCPRCQRKHKTVAKVRAAMAGYVAEVAR